MPRGLWYILNLLRVIQSVILKGEFEGGSRKLASGTSGREMGWQRIKSENAGDSTLDRKERKMKKRERGKREGRSGDNDPDCCDSGGEDLDLEQRKGEIL